MGQFAASAARATRLRLGFFTMSKNPALRDAYQEECARVGYTDGFFMYPSGPSFVHLTEDPEKAWAELGPYALYDMQSYETWQTGDHDNPVAVRADTVEDLQRSGMWAVVTPDECVELARSTGSVPLHPLMGGMPTELGWESLQLYVDKVAPQLSA